MPVDAVFADPRLASVYDACNPPTPDGAFYLELAGAEPVALLDLGCGTGRLAVSWAARGHAVTGVDPAESMLEVARSREGGGLVRWVRGDARDVDLGDRFELIVMYGHVFQVFLDDRDVEAVLANARRHLAPGGCLAFETREPRAREWEGWTVEATWERVDAPAVGPVEVEYQVTDVAPPLVTFETRHVFVETGERFVSPSTLRFWSRNEVAGHLAAAGFDGVRWLGDWDGSGHTDSSPEIIVIARSSD